MKEQRDVAQIVADGYDALGGTYRDWASGIAGTDPREAWLDRLVATLPPGARVLDLGCGPGVPTARRLAEQFDVTGVDLSARQIAFARQAVPSGRFVVADMTTVEFAPASFDAVVAFYSVIHVPNAALPALLGRINEWLVPGGQLLATLAARESEGVQADWLGVPMFFAGHDPAANRALVAAAGFEPIEDAVESTVEPGEGRSGSTGSWPAGPREI